MELETYFVVLINKDGTFSTTNEVPEGAAAARPANTLDIYNVSKQIVQEVDAQILTDRIVSAVSQVITASQASPNAEVPNKVKEALKERGIDPESITPAE
jgi:hypothetical protein